MRELDRLRELIGRHASEGHTPTALPGVSVVRATAAAASLGEVAEPALAVIAQGVKETAVGGRVLRYGPGFAVGYGSPSQFSREYRRMFGTPPSRDTLTPSS